MIEKIKIRPGVALASALVLALAWIPAAQGAEPVPIEKLPQGATDGEGTEAETRRPTVIEEEYEIVEEDDGVGDSFADSMDFFHRKMDEVRDMQKEMQGMMRRFREKSRGSWFSDDDDRGGGWSRDDRRERTRRERTRRGRRDGRDAPPSGGGGGSAGSHGSRGPGESGGGWGQHFKGFPFKAPNWGSLPSMPSMPSMDVWGTGGGGDLAKMKLDDRGDHFVITVAMPGVSRQQIKLKVGADEVTVESRREEVKKRERSGDGWESSSETSSTRMSRKSLKLPESIDPARATSEFEKGRLKITLPKVTRDSKEATPEGS